MKIVIQTQYCENYGAHDWDGKGECPQYWKFKGGETYVIRDLDVAAAMNAAELVAEARKYIEYANEATEEYILGWDLLDDCESDMCESWETPWSLTLDDEGKWYAYREILNDDEYGYMRQDVSSKIESYLMVQEGGRDEYLAKYKMQDGSYTDWQGNRIKEAA